VLQWGKLLGLRAESKVESGARGEGFPRAHGLTPKLTVNTVAARKPLTVGVEARSTGVVVRGNLPADVPHYEARFAYPDPVELFGHAVVGGLAQRGIEIAGGFRRQRDVEPGNEVARMRSDLRSTLVPVLTHSNNSVADQVFFALGNHVTSAGDRAGGRAAVSTALRRLGVSADSLVQVDGSGLSRDNLVTTRQLVALLDAVLASDAGTAALFRAALPVAGETGSLAKRMRDAPTRGRVWAKTGWIRGTSGLAGFVRTRDERTLVFGILVDYPNKSGLNTHCWKPMQDAICEVLYASE